jgi:hypothetical protein
MINGHGAKDIDNLNISAGICFEILDFAVLQHITVIQINLDLLIVLNSTRSFKDIG